MAAPVRIGVIGAGKNSQRSHLPVLKLLAEEGVYTLVVLCDLNLDVARSAAESFGFENYTSNAEEVISRADVDVVFVFGTVQMHAEFMLEALQAGKHVFVEKPPASSIEEIRQALHLSRANKRIVAVGFNRRFYASLNEMKYRVGSTSEIVSFEAVYHKTFLNQTYMHGSSSWITYSSIHAVDAVCSLMEGMPEKLFSAHNTVSGETPQNLSALFVWPGGAHGVLSSNNSTGSRAERYTLHTRGASYTATDTTLTVSTEQGEESTSFENNLETRGFEGEHREFAAAIREGGKLRHGLEEALKLMHLLTLMEQGFCGTIDWSSILSDISSAPKESESFARAPAKLEPTIVSKGRSILVLNPSGLKAALPKLAGHHTIVYEKDVPTLSEESRNDIAAIITGSGGSPVSEEMLALLPSLRVVGVVGASVKKYNPEAILKRGIPIVNASDIYAEAVAEFALMQLLVGIRKASRSHDAMQAGQWGTETKTLEERLIQFLRKTVRKSIFNPIRPILTPLGRPLASRVPDISSKKTSLGRGGNNLKGITVGLVGWGEIAKKFAEMLTHFGCTIKVYSDYVTSEEERAYKVHKAGLAETLNCAVVSLHRGLSERTRKSFGRREITLMRPGAVFINTARGEIVDEEALVERLKKGDLFACLDVFSQEPLPARHVLRRLPNVFLTSHIAGATMQTYTESPEAVVDRVIAYLNAGAVSSRMITSEELLQNMS